MTRITLLDGGIGVELRRRTDDPDTALLPASILIDSPGTVVDVHRAYLDAGADVITTNTYATVEARLAPHLAAQWEDLMQRAALAAIEARGSRKALIAGCLPPLHGSYRPADVGAFSEILSVYQQHVAVLAPFVDVWLCETMSNAAEARAAAEAACPTGKPVWVSWTIADDATGKLRSGETIGEAYQALDDLPVAAALVNCASPEAVTAAMPRLAATGATKFGGHANGFSHIPAGWKLADGMATLGKRRDLDPATYARHALQWVGAGATIVGGCCEVGPAHIAALAKALASRHLREPK